MEKTKPRKRLRPRGFFVRWNWVLIPVLVLLVIPAMQVAVVRLTLSLPLTRPLGLPIYVAAARLAPFINQMGAVNRVQSVNLVKDRPAFISFLNLRCRASDVIRESSRRVCRH